MLVSSAFSGSITPFVLRRGWGWVQRRNRGEGLRSSRVAGVRGAQEPRTVECLPAPSPSHLHAGLAGARAHWLLVTVAAQVRRLYMKDPSPAHAPDVRVLGPRVIKLTNVSRAGVIFWPQMLLETSASKVMGKKVNKSEPITTSSKLNTFLGLDISARSWLPFMTLSFESNLPLTGLSQGRAFDSPLPPPQPPLSVCQPFLHQLYLLQSSPVNCHSLHTDCQ